MSSSCTRWLSPQCRVAWGPRLFHRASVSSREHWKKCPRPIIASAIPPSRPGYPTACSHPINEANRTQEIKTGQRRMRGRRPSQQQPPPPISTEVAPRGTWTRKKVRCSHPRLSISASRRFTAAGEISCNVSLFYLYSSSIHIYTLYTSEYLIFDLIVSHKAYCCYHPRGKLNHYASEVLQEAGGFKKEKLENKRIYFMSVYWSFWWDFIFKEVTHR